MGEGPVALLLHGTGASSHSWAAVAPLLAREFTVVAPDLPGHAFTESPGSDRLTLTALAESIAQLVDTLKLDVELCIGHSSGAAIGARMTLDERIAPRALFGLNGAYFPLRGLSGVIFPVAARVLSVTRIAPRMFAWRAGNAAAVERLILATGSRLDQSSTDLYAMLVRNVRHVRGALDMMAHWQLDPLVRDLRRLRVPLALMVGTDDRAVPPRDARRLMDLLPAATLRTLFELHGAGHLAHEERPEAVSAWITRMNSSPNGWSHR